MGYYTDGSVKCNHVTTESIRIRNTLLSTTGYYDVPTCGVDNKIHFAWNGSKIAIWVNSTQIGYLALQ